MSQEGQMLKIMGCKPTAHFSVLTVAEDIFMLSWEMVLGGGTLTEYHNIFQFTTLKLFYIHGLSKEAFSNRYVQKKNGFLQSTGEGISFLPQSWQPGKQYILHHNNKCELGLYWTIMRGVRRYGKEMKELQEVLFTFNNLNGIASCCLIIHLQFKISHFKKGSERSSEEWLLPLFH